MISRNCQCLIRRLSNIKSTAYVLIVEWFSFLCLFVELHMEALTIFILMDSVIVITKINKNMLPNVSDRVFFLNALVRTNEYMKMGKKHTLQTTNTYLPQQKQQICLCVHSTAEHINCSLVSHSQMRFAEKLPRLSTAVSFGL